MVFLLIPFGLALLLLGGIYWGAGAMLSQEAAQRRAQGHPRAARPYRIGSYACALFALAFLAAGFFSLWRFLSSLEGAAVLLLAALLSLGCGLLLLGTARRLREGWGPSLPAAWGARLGRRAGMVRIAGAILTALGIGLLAFRLAA